LPPGTNPSRRRSMRASRDSCLPLQFGASRSEDLRLDRVGKARAPCDSGLSRNLRDYESASASITLSFMDQNLCRRLVPRPKLGRSHPTTAALAPATSRSVHLQVVGREQMAMTADIGYGHGSRIRSREKHTTSVLVAPKHAPATNFNGLHRRAPDCLVGPPSSPPRSLESPGTRSVTRGDRELVRYDSRANSFRDRLSDSSSPISRCITGLSGLAIVDLERQGWPSLTSGAALPPQPYGEDSEVQKYNRKVRGVIEAVQPRLSQISLRQSTRAFECGGCESESERAVPMAIPIPSGDSET
jgi:hypothetical protein